ncbi:MAG: LLM class F420-dependent oxidoreductase [Chloroflexi bacterium]|nr:LLM class F420-dependent oxidoreductase [Chloroflexota bacterium]
MLDLAIMIEGQNGLTWEKWKRIAQAVQDLGFVGLYRSDHYTNASAPDKDSLECWVSLAWLASSTKRIQFGTLVSPLSFRHPTMLARMARDVDALSGGRLTLGLGAGWQEREHTNYGWDLLPLKERFERFRDGLEIISRLFSGDAPVKYSGKYYRVQDAVLLPRPSRKIPILVGGNGEKKTLPLAARYADEWNATFQTPANFARLNARLDDLLRANKRAPSSVRRSMMTGCIFGKDDAALKQKIAARNRTPEQLRERGIIVGSASECIEQLKQLEKAGLQRVMLQWLDLDDIDGLEAIAKQVIPQSKP